MGSDLPDINQTIRRLDDDTRELISRKMTFVLRGWSNSKKDDPRAPKVYFHQDDMSVEFDEFVEAMKKVYRAINVAKMRKSPSLARRIALKFTPRQTKVSACGSTAFARSRAIGAWSRRMTPTCEPPT